ncbi:hypothetical protein GJR96_14640 [Haloferax sp. MBLA0076]|uniref:DUF8173 domain-containing protein n=1 Tax=Haloferax litoreum TaxID=2666140 RepID=A0A6A8GK08_9EURY|nr:MULTISPECIES: hypothetical protein [Haloferax]KAB1194612.1 hypothetical protein Hfx1148_14570 [Haloferax sp. CBA1148]MRX23189.1 hypothetical protein [Haloferax litoreum]
MDPFTLTILQQAPITPGADPSTFARFFGSTVSAVGTFVGTLILGALLIALAPDFTERVIDTIEDEPVTSFLWGFGIFVAFIVVIIVLIITLIGIVVAVPLIFLMIFVSLFGGALVFIYVGERLLEAANVETSRWGHLVAGAFVATVLAAIPVIGGITNFVVNTVGVGALVYYWRNK